MEINIMFENKFREFVETYYGIVPTHCVISHWMISALDPCYSQYIQIKSDGVTFFRGIKLVPSNGINDMYFYIGK